VTGTTAEAVVIEDCGHAATLEQRQGKVRGDRDGRSFFAFGDDLEEELGSRHGLSLHLHPTVGHLRSRVLLPLSLAGSPA